MHASTLRMFNEYTHYSHGTIMDIYLIIIIYDIYIYVDYSIYIYSLACILDDISICKIVNSQCK